MQDVTQLTEKADEDEENSVNIRIDWGWSWRGKISGEDILLTFYSSYNELPLVTKAEKLLSW